MKIIIKTFLVDTIPMEPRYSKVRKTIHDFEQNGLPFSAQFRFTNGNQLRRLLNGFRFPDGTVRIKKYKFTSEEILLISLTRLSWPLRWTDVQERFPNRSSHELSLAFYYFLDFMISNWGYLILNNRSYWLPWLEASANSIRMKLQTLANEEYRQYYDVEDGFRVAMFIDNTILAMCRPGGGPLSGGEQAPRLPPEIQEAFWTGWKKLHGLKWQTLILANGMDFEVWGPASVRHNDNFTLHRSNILAKLHTLQLGQPIQYCAFGDSAYSPDEYILSGGGRGMASVRESVEWTYKDIKTQWKYCDYRHCLQLRNQPLGKIFFVCMLLRNAHVTLNGSQTSEYFTLEPPSLEHWLSQGPRAQPIPEDVFN